MLKVPTPAVRKPGSVWTELPRPVSVGAEPVGHVRLGYARASTARQPLDAQLASLAEAGVTRIFSEKGGCPRCVDTGCYAAISSLWGCCS
ncbi:hypothetical protein ACIG5D_08265 [Microbispora rosea]|uniref:hypothetical protein n=1 Tax=Microbispora rosea TaxID=58117 RepID=UPI003789A62F